MGSIVVGNNYSRYIASRVIRDLDIDVFIVNVYGKYYATRLSIGTSLHWNGNTTETGLLPVNKTLERINAFIKQDDQGGG